MAKSNRITVESAVVLIRSTNGKLFTATFRKKDGTFRKMNCRTGVQKNLKGVGHRFDPKDIGQLTVYDVQKRQYRMLNTESLISVTVEGESYRVIQ